MGFNDTITQILHLAEGLEPDDQLALAQELIAVARSARPAKQVYEWESLRGLVPHPMLGEDAQTYISRTRREDSEQSDNTSLEI